MTGLALITGGQQGIGLGIARSLAAAGFRLALLSEVPATAPAVQNVLRELPDAAYFRHDLRDIADAGSVLDRIGVAQGPVTTLVSNAGVPSPVRGDILDLGAEAFDSVHAINLRGTFFLAQEVSRRMLDLPPHPYRSLIFVTSVSAAMVSPERAEYCLSKAGAAMMAQLFAVRLAPHDIGVFDLRPGIIDTAMTAGVHDAYSARIAEGLVPARRWGLPADIGSVVVPLATGQMAFATGAVIAVDGGLSIGRL